MRRPKRPKREVSGILLLDKPLGVSSNHALQQVKRLYQAEKAGHTGSLDPLASGMLPICLGEATKLSGVLLDSDKTYRATLRLGQKTTTGDAEGEVIETSPMSVQEPALLTAICGFVGSIEQIPPMYSALKRDGVALYKLAREGVEVARAPRPVVIHQLTLDRFAMPEVDFTVTCSKGTYVRTLAEDLAASVGECGHLTALRRIGVAPFGQRPMVTMAELEHAAEQGLSALDALLLSPAEGLAHWPTLRVDDVRAAQLAHGRAVRIPGAPRGQRVAVVAEDGQLLGLAEAGDDAWVAPRRWLRASPCDPVQ